MSLADANVVDPRRKKRVAIVLANPSRSTTTGWPVGFWWSEVTHPWYEFQEVGYEVEIFSPRGGRCEADAISDPRDASGYSAHDLITLGFLHTPRLAAAVETTRPVADLALDRFDAIMVAGGQSPMFTFADEKALHAKFAAFLAAGKVAAALCHGVAVLAHARGADGQLLAKGRTVTGFANVEEDAADAAMRAMQAIGSDAHVMPWRIEDALRRGGANFVSAGAWRPFAIRDGNLVTGQQNFSGAATARLVIEALGR
ncbi:MAG: type 1 glutamine amidotransferase domain-containing protein [Planctomycetes bacterium]|nr:type 1 glutamine amidotransferase domain-containing protein [Planctomycetota bacterium]